MASYLNADALNPEGGFVKQANQQARLGFVRKVYGILSAQLIVTVVIAAYISHTAETLNPQTAQMFLIGSAILSLATICAMSCCHDMAKKFPTNYIMLGLFTVAESVLVGFTCSRYPPQVVLGCAGLTAGMFIGLTVYAMTCASDFTGLGPFLAAALISMIVLMLGICAFSFFFPNAASIPILNKVCAGIMVMLFSFYIVYDTQMMIGNGITGKAHKQEFELDDYVFAALNLYLDVLNLFLYLLELFGNRDN